MKKLLILPLLLVVSIPAAAEPARLLPPGQHPQSAISAGGYGYQLFIPRSAAPSSARTWPLMIFLHGSGERGDDIARVKVHGPPRLADRNPDFPFILISPLLPTEQDWDIAKLNVIL